MLLLIKSSVVPLRSLFAYAAKDFVFRIGVGFVCEESAGGGTSLLTAGGTLDISEETSFDAT